MQTRKRFIALLICLTVLPALAGRLVLQNNGLYGYSDTTDAWLNESDQNDNNGGDSKLQVRYDMNDGGYAEDCALVRFTLPSVVSDGLTAAALGLYYRAEGSMQADNVLTLKPYRLTSDWYENLGTNLNGQGVSWDYRDAGETLSWTSQYGGWYDKADDGNGTNRVKRAGGSGSGIEPLNWASFNVLPSVQLWLGGSSNYGLILFSGAFEGGGTMIYAVFDSSEYADSATRPKLTLTYRNARLLWSGAVDGTWDASTANWSLGGLNGFYDAGDPVRFDTGTRTNVTVASAGVAPGPVVFSNATSRFILSGGPIGGTNGLTKYRAGEARLAATNSYSGLTDLVGGTLLVATNQALGSVATGTVVRSGATLLLEGGVLYDAPEPLSLAGTGATGAGALAASAGASRFAGPVTLAAAADIGAPTNATLTLSGAIGGAAGWRKTGDGTVTLSGSATNTHGGTVTVLGGTLRLAKGGSVAIPAALAVGDGTRAASVFADSFGAFAPTVTVSVAAHGLLDLQEHPSTLAGLAMSGGRLSLLGSSTLTLEGPFDYTGTDAQAWVSGGQLDLKAERRFTVADGTPPDDVLLDAAILSGSLVKAGPGTLALRAASAFKGGTTVEAGTLLVTNTSGSATGAGPVLVKNGATLAGCGHVAGVVTVEDYGWLSPGRADAASLSLGKLSLSTNACLRFDLSAPGSSNDALTVASDLTLDGTLQVATGPSFGPGRYRIFTYGGVLTDRGLTVAGLPAQYDVDVDTGTSGEVWLDVALTPEHFVAASGLNVAPYTNWATAAHMIQDALDATRPGDTVWVNDGVYATGGKVSTLGGSLTNRVCVPEQVALRSLNGPTFTSIEGSPDPILTNGPAAIRGVLLAPGARLSGFTVTGGYTALAGIPPWDTDGGGVLAVQASVSNCAVTCCSAWRGGGLAIHGQPTGVFALRHVSACGNRAATEGGGVRSEGGILQAACCLLTSNRAVTRGGGAYANGRVAFDSLTVASNAVSSGTGGGVQVTSASVLADTIVCANRALTSDNYAPPTFFFGNACCSHPVLPGLGNIDADPAFRSPASGDFRLLYGSPCADTSSGAAAGSRDLDGRPRPVDGDFDDVALCDMGAFEYAPEFTDCDGDTMPDGWEHRHGLQPLDPADAHDNPDRDAHDNLQEYVADTDPQSGASYFRVTAISNGVPVDVWFESSDARVYTLWRRDTLTSGGWTNVAHQTRIPGHGGPDRLADPDLTTTRLYRLTVELP